MNIDNSFLFWVGVFLTILGVFLVVFAWRMKQSHKRPKPRLKLAIFFFTNKQNKMSTVNSVVFTALAPDQGVIAVVDTANGNAILTGTLANLSAVPADAAVDTASIDATVANTLDVAPVTNTGSTMVTVKGDFTSAGNAGIPDGTVFPGIAVQVAVTNNIPVTPPPPPTPVPGLQVTFP